MASKNDKKHISYAITACNELDELNYLINLLSMNKRVKDEIVILLDESSYTKEVEELVLSKTGKKNNIKYYKHPLNLNFGEFKNKLNEYCKRDFIFQIDADEFPSAKMIKKLPKILDENKIDLFYIPRLNILKPLNSEMVNYVFSLKWKLTYHSEYTNTSTKNIDSELYDFCKKNGWIYSEDKHTFTYYVPIINFPDYQGRIYRNSEDIKWEGKVHERIVGHDNLFYIPKDRIDLCLFHNKTLEKQKKQNEFYSKI